MKDPAPETPLLGNDSSDSDLERDDDFATDFDFGLSPEKTMFSPELRADHLQTLLMKQRTTVRYLDKNLKEKPSSSGDSLSDHLYLSDTTKEKARHERAALEKVEQYLRNLRRFFDLDRNTVEIHLNEFCYISRTKTPLYYNAIRTVYNQGLCYKLSRWILRKRRGLPEPKEEIVEKVILDRINLILEPSKMYLVLGAPGSGKTSLLRSIAGRLSMSNGEATEGTVTYNGISKDETDLYVENLISFIGQHDYHAPRLTVEETFEFGWQCKSGGTHAAEEFLTSEAACELIRALNIEKAAVKAKLDALELEHVSNTFVGSSDVRGVSGGQRRRVSVGEMPLTTTPVLCGDELSTGLDAASTYQIMYVLMHYTRLHNMTRVISLLQPTPETVSLFDDIILLAKGKLLYAGPVGHVESYFASLGYHPPELMDIADFLQMITTQDGEALFNPTAEQMKIRGTPYSIDELAEKFRESYAFRRIKDQLRSETTSSYQHERGSPLRRFGVSEAAVLANSKRKYANSFFRSVWLLLKRNILLWLRDRRFLIVNFVKNVIMGVSVGGVFFRTDSVASIFGALFQLTLFIMLGAMVTVPDQISDRAIFYKHFDSNFYGAFPYVVGRALALLPQTFIDIMIFGTIIYWFVGLAPTVHHYFTYIAILFVFSLVMNQTLAIAAAVAKTKTGVQGFSACVLFLLVLTCGFIVTPDNIPVYYLWIYWWSPLAWTYRALLVNEFQSSEYDVPLEGTGQTVGDSILTAAGFTDPNGNAFSEDWIGYSFAFMVPYFSLCVLTAGLFLTYVRVEDVGNESTETTSVESKDVDKGANGETKRILSFGSDREITIPFKPVTLSFQNICYDVAASKGKTKLRLLHNVDGIFESGRMCALMGSSGSGKTTLLDVIALRKNTGTVLGDILVNGFPQEAKTFRRCSGYVEQFDVQAPELTVRETVLYSARLRLDSDDPVLGSDREKVKFVDSVLRKLELQTLADCLVGDSDGGLSFEQRKRLSIAVELAASPSIIFLDEPTSGLEARAALMVVRLLRQIADEGRTIVSTIHQPSLACFQMFDDLLLLKKGGHVVFFDELGPDCRNLVQYFESHGVRKIDSHENPASWMLTAALGSEMLFIDFEDEYRASDSYARLKWKLSDIKDNPDPSQRILYRNEFATDRTTRQNLVNARLRTIYWRSPAYNRLRMVIYLAIALVLGSVFLPESFAPEFYTETEMSSLLATTFISFIFTGVLAINSVLPVMLKIRDSFYRQRQCGMVDDVSFSLGLGVAEKWFILFSSFLFCVVFLPCAGIGLRPGRAISFSGIFCFNTAIYSYFGQAFMCLVSGMPQAQILASIFIGLNNFFSGLIVRPQYLTGFFAIPFWITPGHFVYEGLVVSLFYNETTPVFATPGSDFYESLGCSRESDAECVGTAWEYVDTFFGGKYQRDHLYYDVLVLGFYLTLARLITFLALKYFTFTA